jgi:hypothetical protein
MHVRLWKGSCFHLPTLRTQVAHDRYYPEAALQAMQPRFPEPLGSSTGPGEVDPPKISYATIPSFDIACAGNKNVGFFSK